MYDEDLELEKMSNEEKNLAIKSLKHQRDVLLSAIVTMGTQLGHIDPNMLSDNVDDLGPQCLQICEDVVLSQQAERTVH
jgi:hypothetical protein